MKLIKLEQKNCNPCKQVSLYLDSKDVSYIAIDVQEHREYLEKYNVLGVPVTILLDDEGNEVERTIGFNSDQLDNIISKL